MRIEGGRRIEPGGIGDLVKGASSSKTGRRRAATAWRSCGIVSGAAGLLALHPFAGVPILPPRDFLAAAPGASGG
jgi:hypothetical protein